MGFIGPNHVDAVRRAGYADVTLIADRNVERLAARAQDLAVPRWTTDIDAVLADRSIDVVHVCTPNMTHPGLAEAALAAGKHVVVEKPLATDALSARRLASLALEGGRHAMVPFTYRGYPMVRRARELMESGDLGELRLVHGHYLQDWLAHESDYDWRVEPTSGGTSRAVADIGSHWFDTVEFVAGRRVEAVFANLATLIPFRWRPVRSTVAFAPSVGPGERVAVETEDAATLLVRFTEGAVGACIISQVSLGHKNDLAVELGGSLRSLAWHQEDPESLWLGTRTGTERIVRGPSTTSGPGIPSLPAGHPEGWGEALRDLFRSFYASVASGAEPASQGQVAPYPTFLDGARAVTFVEAALQSSRTSHWVKIPDGVAMVT